VTAPEPVLNGGPPSSSVSKGTGSGWLDKKPELALSCKVLSFAVSWVAGLPLNYSKVFICDFGQEELLKPDQNLQEIGCDANCSPGESFDVCILTGAEDQLTVGAMICSDREFPEPSTQLMLNGAELIVVPNACTWDDIRTAGLKTRAFDNMVGVAMVNYPGPRAGNSQACTCVAWQGGKPQDTVIGRAGEEEEIILVRFDVDQIRELRTAESWRMDYRRHGSLRHIAM
jgi:N-carbamoylputrescine amidase